MTVSRDKRKSLRRLFHNFQERALRAYVRRQVMATPLFLSDIFFEEVVRARDFREVEEIGVIQAYRQMKRLRKQIL